MRKMNFKKFRKFQEKVNSEFKDNGKNEDCGKRSICSFSLKGTYVVVRGSWDLEFALRKFKKIVEKSGIIYVCRKKSKYIKPSERKRSKLNWVKKREIYRIENKKN